MAATTEQMLKEIADELFSVFESMETQSGAIAMFLKEKGIASDEELAPFLQQAGDASSVKWLAARVRFDHLLSSIAKNIDEGAKNETAKPSKEEPESTKAEQKKPDEKPREKTPEEKTGAQPDTTTQENSPEREPAVSKPAVSKDQPSQEKHKNQPQAVEQKNTEEKDHAA
jgi:outer membrane biosynthesis protein TonB